MLVTVLSAFFLSVAAATPPKASSPFLPPLLKLKNGDVVTSVDQWMVRKAQIKDMLQNYILGYLPEKAPVLVGAKLVNSTLDPISGSSRSTFVELSFDVDVNFSIEVIAPESCKSAGAKCPLFLTQWNHRGWALLGVSRGYVSLVYPAADTRDIAPKFQEKYPNSSMALIIARAFVASRVLDYILSDKYNTLGLDIETSQIAITGHSRNGKQSLIAAAFDERITAVVGSSPGAPISSPYHFSSPNYYGEGPDAGTAACPGSLTKWWICGITNYTYQPGALPMDGHGVLGLIAPRAAAIATGWTDKEGDTSFADELNIKAVSAVYRLLGQEERLRIIHRPGDHHGFDSVNSYFDYFDHHFARLSTSFDLGYSQVSKTNVFPMRYLTPAGFNWTVWRDTFSPHHQPPGPNASLLSRVSWLLQLSIGISSHFNEAQMRSGGSSYSEEASPGFLYTSVMLRHNAEQTTSGAIERQPVSFGDYVTGNVYWKAGTTVSDSELQAAIIWLHPYSYATGYASTYGQSMVHEDLARSGVVVLAYDQVGFATRIREGGTTFYARYGGRASLLGHMVKDAIAAVDFLMCRAPTGTVDPLCSTGEHFGGSYPNNLVRIPRVDPSKIFIAGYSLGANVALHAAALDGRIAGIASFSGFTPMKTDIDGLSTGGARRLYELHALVPRLGLLASAATQNGAQYIDVPYDYEELISSIAPRHILLYAQEFDRDANIKDVKACIDGARTAWIDHNASAKFSSVVAMNIGTQMRPAESKVLCNWLNSSLKEIKRR
eukprot:UC4_evm3s399